MGKHTPPQLKVKAQRRLAPTPRLKSGVLRVLRPDGVYVGTGDRGIVLNLPGAAAVTERLDGKRSRVDIAIETGVSKDRIERMLNLINGAGLLDRDYTECAFTPAIAARLVPELDAAAYRPGVIDGGGALMERRSAQRVDVLSGDRIGLLIATTLAASGVGGVRVFDDREATPVDVIGGSAQMSDVGSQRSGLAAQRIKEAMPVEGQPSGGTPELTIVTRSPAPEQVMEFGLAGRAHLVISPEPDGIVVGPLVLPGQSACTRCIALHQVDRDRHFGALELARLQRTITPSALGAHLAAAQASAQALSWLDTGRSAAINATLHINLDDAFVRPRSWSTHLLCGCTWAS